MKLTLIFYAAFTFWIAAPLPPGPIDRNQSNFHPEKLHLKWTVPINNTKVDSYQITISDQHSTIITSYPSSDDLEVSKRFQPGTNYTVKLYTRSYGSYSLRYTEEIQTLRKFTAFISIYDIVTNLLMKTLTILRFHILFDTTRHSPIDDQSFRLAWHTLSVELRDPVYNKKHLWFPSDIGDKMAKKQARRQHIRCDVQWQLSWFD